MTFFPKTIEEISKVIHLAKILGKRVRAAGMKHSWTDLFSNDGEYLICLLPLEVTDHLTFSRVGVKGAEEELKNWGSDFTSKFATSVTFYESFMSHILTTCSCQ